MIATMAGYSVIDTDNFTYHADSKLFTAEASDLSDLVPKPDRSTGKPMFYLRSTRTQRTLEFVQLYPNQGMNTQENEREYWEYHCTHPMFGYLRVKIWND